MTEVNTTTTRACRVCNIVKNIYEYPKSLTNRGGRATRCKTCTGEYLRQYQAKNKERLAAYQKRHYLENKESYSAAGKANYGKNKEAYKERAARWALENPEARREVRLTYDRANREKKSANGKRHRDLNPGYYRAHFKKRQQQKRNAMPAWADEAAMKAIYEECSRISKETGVKHHVDHFYPLQNELVCGLHVEHNLRIISAFDNLSKGNSFPTEDL